MSLRDRFAAALRAQRSARFKVVVSAVIVALAVVVFSWWAIAVNAPAGAERREQAAQLLEQQRELSPDERLDAERIIASLQTRGAAPTVALAIGSATAVALAVVWLGLGLTYALWIAAGLFIAGPLYLFEPTRTLGQVFLGGLALTACFSALTRLLHVLLGRGGPAMAVAQTVLSEALRMKISLVFIVMLVFLLACLPMLLDDEALLRYRIQSFMQYAVGGTFWVLALLTLFFSVATVAFEQRDRIIWQTMSKPITPFGYLFGKWLGVMAVNAALLGVSAVGVFLFTEHLRQQPAEGERVAFVNADGSLEQTPDRRAIESQILVARRSVKPTREAIDPEAIREAVRRRLDEAVNRDPSLNGSPAIVALAEEFEREELRDFSRQQRTIEPGRSRRFVFGGLGGFRDRARAMAEAGREPPALALRTKIHAGADNPNSLYRVTFVIAGVPISRDVPLNVVQTEPLRYAAIDDDGNIVVEVINADIRTGQTNYFPIQMNAQDFEILYPFGGYEWNFARIMLLNLAKLGFIAAVGVAAATGLSFPVACMLTLLVLLASETAGFLAESLQYFPIMGESGDAFSLKGFVIQVIAWPISQAFTPYAELRPTMNLVDGRLVPFFGVVRAAAGIAGASGVILAFGWLAFRRRELATYSGH